MTGKLVRIGFGLAALAFGVVFVVGHWSQVRDALTTAHPGWIVLAALFAVAGQWVAALGLGPALGAVAPRPPQLEVIRVYFVSQLGKYIPGAVWPIVAVVAMCRRFGIAPRAAAVGGSLATLFALTTGASVGVVFVLVAATGSTVGLLWLLLLVPLLVVLMHPRVLTAIVNRLLRLLRREPVALNLGGRTLAAALGWPALSWLLLGAHCWALVVAFDGPTWSSLPGSIGGFALAYVAGVVAVFAPAGAGVREAVLAASLAGVTSDASFGHTQIVVVVLVSRVMLAVLDFAEAGAATLLVRLRARPVHAAAGSPAGGL